MTEQLVSGCCNMPFGGPFTDQAPALAASADLSRGRAALIERWRWPQDKKVLFVGFLNGSASIQDKVKSTVPEWSKYCRMVFDFSPRDPRQCDILINFLVAPGAGERTYNSYLGTDCLNHTRSPQASMNLVFPAGTAPDFMTGTILHEFGHALGLDHEHKRPDKPFRWVPQKVYQWAADMAGPDPRSPWRDPAFVNLQVITPFTELFKHSRFDPLSIMMYPFPPGLAFYEDGTSFSTKPNYVLSKDDKEFIEIIYPPRPGGAGGGKIVDRELDLGSSVSATIDGDVAGQRYHFTLANPCLVSFRTQDAAAAVRGVLFGPDDPKRENPEKILHDGSGVNLQEEGRLMEPGDWWLRVTFRDDGTRGDYRLRVTVDKE